MVNWKRYIFPLILAAIGGYVFLASGLFPDGGDRISVLQIPFYPRLLATLLIIGAIGLLFERQDSAEKEKIELNKITSILVFALMVVVYVFALKFLGHLVATIVFCMVASSWLLSKAQSINIKLLLKTMVINLILGVVAFVLFYYGWQIPLPLGTLWG